MKHATALFILSLLVLGILPAQAQITDKTSPNPINTVTKEQLESAGQTNIHAILASIPVAKGGEFYGYGAGIRVQRNFNRSMTIIDGINVDAARQVETNQAFIITKEEVEKYGSIGNSFNEIERIEVIKGGFQAEFGATMLFGQSEPYKVDNLNIIHAFVGYRRMPCPQGDISIEVGPAIGFFSNGSEFGVGGSFNGFYDFTKPAKNIYNIITTGKKPVTWSAGVGIDFYKLHEFDLIVDPHFGIRVNF